MEEEFAQALTAAGDKAYAVMIGPNALILGIIIVIGLVVISYIAAKYRANIAFGKSGLVVGVDKANTHLDELINEIKGIKLDVLRIYILMEENPLEERIRAGKEYVSNGGNGFIELKLEELKKQWREEQRRDD
jgi:hypothetical protein